MLDTNSQSKYKFCPNPRSLSVVLHPLWPSSKVTFITLPYDSLSLPRLGGTVVGAGASCLSACAFPCTCSKYILLTPKLCQPYFFQKGNLICTLSQWSGNSASKPEEVFLEHASDSIISDTPPPPPPHPLFYVSALS